MKIRQAEIKDTKEILALIKAKAEFDNHLDSLLATEKSITEAFFSTSPKSWAIVAEIDSQLVGIATYYNIYSTFKAKPGIWLDDLFIYPQYRNMGIGKALIKKLCFIAQENGCCRLDWIVACDNKNGTEFYEYLGAKIFEEVRHARLDEIAISRLLDNNV
ncbi:GNAT family N-acetyltransferase [Cellvibrio sp. PSBB023]|uniref:GNAT family N-acetyltransferase n=1 Tax=Cellvibrio sp. PSBB023 TaxID=1945512 RepID=UPI0009900956|nr:GNAT family N-acetyltransferase [Cellvibrio sp. PSBB023]AQT60456.1 GNAT family N-acetyltransferase [Cellvibrio sp. PSBB023]